MPRWLRFVWRGRIFLGEGAILNLPFSILNFQAGVRDGYRPLSLHLMSQIPACQRMENGEWNIENAVVQLLTASRCFYDFGQQTEQFLIVGVHRIELFFIHEFAVA
jgi:hypothetical protein